MAPQLRTAARIAAFYAAIFSAIGVQLPFWPVWLKDRGLTPAQIGLVMAATYLTRIISNPLAGQVVDRRGDRKRPMIVLAFAAMACWSLFSLAEGVGAIVAVTIVAVGLFAAVLPVGDSLALMAAADHKLDYGRMRLWGSIAFIVAASLVGKLLVHQPPAILVWLVCAGLGLTTLAAMAVPDLRAPPHEGGKPAPVAPLLKSRPFLLFLAAAALNQTAHTVYYAFATIHWRDAGIGDDVIGLLWSEGVMAEIILFGLCGTWTARLGPARLILLAGLGGALRWTVLGVTTALPALATVQILHAATFGCAHLGAMHFLQKAVPRTISVRANGLYASLAVGLAPGLMTPFTGKLYEAAGGGAFLLMAALSAGCAALAWLLKSRWDGKVLV